MGDLQDDELAELVECVTPRQRVWIAAAAHQLTAHAISDVERFGDNSVDAVGGWLLFDRLPDITWTLDSHWRLRFAQCGSALADDVAAIGAPIPRCTGEELMLHLVLRCAETMTADPARTVGVAAADGDHDWNLLSEVLFQHHDVLMLYDGFTPEQVTEMSGVHIAPANWFDQFGTHLPVPDRPTDHPRT